MKLVITFRPNDAARALVSEIIGDSGEVRYLADVEGGARRALLAQADILLARNTATELQPDERPLVAKARLIQFVTAGVDHIPLNDLPANVPVAKNAGAYAEPMAEHALAMALAAAKRLAVEQRNMMRGEFNQFVPNKMLRGLVCGIFDFGGIGIAVARLVRCLGMRVHAINRRAASDERVDWLGTPDDLPALLAHSDVFIISTPLTRATQGIIGRRELAAMKDDAILINLARGEIIDEDALYQHLRATPRFTACLDAWWIEPVRHGAFRMDRPFLDLPNVIGSPHNSAAFADTASLALRHALANCRRVLLGEAPLHLVGPDERMR